MKYAALLLLPFLLQEADNLSVPDGVPKRAEELDDEGKKLLDKARKGGANSVDQAEDAIKLFKRAGSAGKNKFARPHYHMGIAYQYTKDYKQAEYALKKAIKINKNFHEAFVELGDVYGWMEKWDKAVAEYQKAIDLKKDYALAHKNMGIAHTWMGEYEKAVDWYKKALDLKPKDAGAKQLLGLVEKEIEGPKFEKEYRKETKHFIIRCNDSQEYTDWLGKHAEIAYEKYASIFPKISTQKRKFPVIVFRDVKEYYAYGSPRNTGGYYMDLLKKLVLFKNKTDKDTLIVLYHEAFHQFLAYYLRQAPQWFNEGHGDYFGPSVYNEKTKKMDIKVNPWRLPVVKRAIQRGTWTPFRKLMLMTRAELYDPKTIGQNYAQSWSMVYFLWHYDKGRYSKHLQKYFQSLRKGSGLKEAFEDGFGKADIAKMEEEWKSFVRNLN